MTSFDERCFVTSAYGDGLQYAAGKVAPGGETVLRSGDTIFYKGKPRPFKGLWDGRVVTLFTTPWLHRTIP